MARGLCKTYRRGGTEVPVFDGVAVDIHTGEFLAIVGPSGNGKSSLVNCLSGLDTIDDGYLMVDGTLIHELSHVERAEHRAARMGFVFQSFNLVGVLSAVENVELPLLAAGYKNAVARSRATELLDQVGLGDRSSHRPGEMSGGEQQRVAIARSLVGQPAVVWADEPTGNLDQDTAQDVLSLFEQVHGNGQTIVMVTHDPDVAARADRIIEVRGGQIRTISP